MPSSRQPPGGPRSQGAPGGLDPNDLMQMLMSMGGGGGMPPGMGGGPPGMGGMGPPPGLGMPPPGMGGGMPPGMGGPPPGIGGMPPMGPMAMGGMPGGPPPGMGPEPNVDETQAGPQIMALLQQLGLLPPQTQGPDPTQNPLLAALMSGSGGAGSSGATMGQY